MSSRKKTVFVDVPASREYLVLDAAGRVIDRSSDLLTALAHGRALLASLCVIGAPSGVMLARIAHGLASDENRAVKAVRRWLRMERAHPPKQEQAPIRHAAG
jgi:hypothetical protein